MPDEVKQRYPTANSAVEFSLDDFGGYAEAAAREQELRRVACLGLNELICGLEVKPLCANHVSLLTLIKSPFLCGFTTKQLVGAPENNFEDGKPDLINDILQFLWIVSPMYKEGSKASTGWRKCNPWVTNRDRFNVAFAPIIKEPINKVVEEIKQYIEDAFIDASDGEKSDGKSYYADEVSIAYELSKNHGYRLDFWNKDCPPEKNPMLVPLKIVFQLRKVRVAAEHGEEGLRNKSDMIIAKSLAAIGKRHREQTNN